MAFRETEFPGAMCVFCVSEHLRDREGSYIHSLHYFSKVSNFKKNLHIYIYIKSKLFLFKRKVFKPDCRE